MKPATRTSVVILVFTLLLYGCDTKRDNGASFSVSDDGKIVYETGGKVWLKATSGSDRLLLAAKNPSFIPGRDSFLASQAGRLVECDTDGNVKDLSIAGGGRDYFPVSDSNGKYVFFCRAGRTRPAGMGGIVGTDFDLYGFESATGSLRKITSLAAFEMRIVPGAMDGEHILAALGDKKSTHQTLAAIDVQSGKTTVLSESELVASATFLDKDRFVILQSPGYYSMFIGRISSGSSRPVQVSGIHDAVQVAADPTNSETALMVVRNGNRDYSLEKWTMNGVRKRLFHLRYE